MQHGPLSPDTCAPAWPLWALSSRPAPRGGWPIRSPPAPAQSSHAPPPSPAHLPKKLLIDCEREMHRQDDAWPGQEQGGRGGHGAQGVVMGHRGGHGAQGVAMARGDTEHGGIMEQGGREPGGGHAARGHATGGHMEQGMGWHGAQGLGARAQRGSLIVDRRAYHVPQVTHATPPPLGNTKERRERGGQSLLCVGLTIVDGQADHSPHQSKLHLRLQRRLVEPVGPSQVAAAGRVTAGSNQYQTSKKITSNKPWGRGTRGHAPAWWPATCQSRAGRRRRSPALTCRRTCRNPP